MHVTCPNGRAKTQNFTCWLQEQCFFHYISCLKIVYLLYLDFYQFSSVTQLCPTL